MSVGTGRIEKRVLKVLEYERQRNDGNLGKTIGEVDGKTVYFECDSTVKDVAYSIVNGCNDKDGVYDEENLGKVYRSIYQSVCRAIRNLERKGFLKTTIVPGGDISGYGWAKAVTLIKSGDKHLETAIKNEGVNT